MSEAIFCGQPFRLDPESVRVGYRMKTARVQTIGGEVVQVLGTTHDTLSISGSFGKGGFVEQRAFLKRMYAIAFYQADSTPGTFRFTWVEKGWDFAIALESYTNPDGPHSVEVNQRIINPKWTLGLYVLDDGGALLTPAGSGADSFIQRLSTGIGWHQTDFNGPDSAWTTSTGHAY